MPEERPADDLVHRVVPADVLAQAEQLTLGVEEACCVQTAGGREGWLGGAKPLGQVGEESGVDGETALHARRLDLDRLERAFPADPTRGAGIEAAPEARGVE